MTPDRSRFRDGADDRAMSMVEKKTQSENQWRSFSFFVTVW